ncbi:hypothetical protein BJ973_002026 [Actinoplanes tereljensis]|uniref:Alpha-amylase n=1 Tax=Paractinoplanes tereljensis TaxID=571912 RepID=A0A919NKY4_9ACTN|nr:carboxypeptidase regulatory-like domain-containing protein [Actinoplanes tereljensis]GIF20068.1 hypothetical protein Ate02nite_27980 [Actinoplanes tereljensis]
MFTIRGRRALATVAAAMLAGLSILTGATPAQAQHGPLGQPTITFPDGSESVAGGTVTVTFDAGGDRRVTGFRYSLGTTDLGLTATATERGGTATVTLGVGTITGDRSLVAAVVDGHGRVGPMTQAAIHVTPTYQFTGRVLNAATFLGVPDVVVTLEPGNLQATTDADGEYAFAAVPVGYYTVSATAEGFCSPSQTFLISGQGVEYEIYLFALDSEVCSPAEVTS